MTEAYYELKPSDVGRVRIEYYGHTLLVVGGRPSARRGQARLLPERRAPGGERGAAPVPAQAGAEMTRIIIELEIEGSPEDAIEVIDQILDWGDFQEEINNWDRDERPLLVTSATCRIGDP